MSLNPQKPGDGGEGMEARIARLESDVAHIRTDLGEFKAEFRDFRSEIKAEMGNLRSEVKAEIGNFRAEVREDFKEVRDNFRILWGGLFVTALGLAGLIAKGFGWI